MTKLKTKKVTGFNDKTLANLAETAKIEGLAEKLIKMREDLNNGFNQDMIDAGIQKRINDGTIGNLTIGDAVISPDKTTFFTADETINLFNGIYKNCKITGNTGGLKFEDGDYTCKTAIVKIKPGTTYSIIKDKVSRFNIATSTKILTNLELADGAVNINLSTNSSPKYYTFTSGSNDSYLYVNVTINNDDVFLQIIEGTQTELTTNKYSIIPNGLDIYSKREVNDLFNNIDVTIENVSFLERANINLFDKTKQFIDTKMGGATGSLTFSKSTGSVTCYCEVKPNTVYSVILEENNLIDSATNKNYFKVFTSSSLYDGTTNYWKDGRNINVKVDARNYTLTTGANDKYLYVYYTDTNEDTKIQIVEGSYNTFVDDKINPIGLNIYNKDEVNDIISSAQHAKPIIVNKTGKNLDILVACKKSTNYVKYCYKRIDDDNINFHQWRVLKTYLVDKNLNTLFDFDGQTEWEGAIQERGAADFICGFHGDENNEFISVMLDGTEIDLNGEDFTKQCSEVRIVNKSIVNRCDTPDDNVFTRYKISIWNADNYIVENKFIALQDFNISSSKICLMSCRYTNSSTQGAGDVIIDTARNNHDYINYDISSAFGTTGIGSKQKDTTEMEMWSNISGMYFRVRCEYDAEKYANRNQYIEDFRSQNRAKVYFDLTGNYAMTTGEKLKCKSIFTLMG